MKISGRLIRTVIWVLLPFLVAAGLLVWHYRGSENPVNDGGISIDTLINRADRISEENPDSAVMLYTILASRFRPGLSDEEKAKIINAQVKKWHLCFFSTYNYAEAYGCMIEALDMMNESGLDNSDVHLRMGLLLHSLAEDCNDTTLMHRSFRHLRTAFNSQIASEGPMIDIITANLILEGEMIDSLDVLKDDMKRYAALPPLDDDVRRIHNRFLYEAFRSKEAADYRRALAFIDSIIAILPAEPVHLRARIIAHMNKADLFSDMGLNDAAVSSLDSALVLANTEDVKDALVEIYGHLWKMWDSKGDRTRATYWQTRYYQLKDSLIGYHSLTRINNIDKNIELSKAESKVVQAESDRKMQRTILLLALGLLFALAVFIYVLSRRNRRLRIANRNLYDRNVEHLVHEREESALRRNYETRILDLSVELDRTKDQLNDLELCAGVSETTAGPSEEPIEEDTQPVRYKNSNLDEERKTTLMNTILSAMESTDEWMTPDFSVKRLGELAGTSYKLVSQVINEKDGRNFNSFVNNYRIDEACRRIADFDNYGSYTLDVILKSVGFKARSSFISAFRQKTGMTPSEYQKIAHADYRQRKKESKK